MASRRCPLLHSPELGKLRAFRDSFPVNLPEILVIPHNHFDPTWRRCFDRPADYDGWRVRSYAEMEDLLLSRSLEFAPRGFTQSEGQIAIWRKYLERHPEAREKIREEVAQKRFCFTLAGETVQDSNLPTPEALVRNFLVAMPLYRELCGEDHDGLKIAWVEDAFGNSPNYPQVLKGVGAETVWRTSYRVCPHEVIVGIDGTRLSCMDHVPNTAAWSVIKYQPCRACKGQGCGVCAQSGVEIFPILTKAFVEEKIEGMVANLLQPPGSEKKEDVTFATGLVFKQDLTSTIMPFLVVGGEETVPEPEVVDAVGAMAEKYRGKVNIRFGTHADIYLRERARLQQLVEKGPELPANDLNPAMPGCYVTRIKAKQRIRALAHRLTAVESVLANRAWTVEKPLAQPEDLNLAWQHITFCCFHDAITGTLIDSAYTELTDLLEEVERISNKYLAPPKAAPPKSFQAVAAKEKAIQQVTWGPFQIEFDLRGITNLLTEGRDLFKPFEVLGLPEKMRIGELALDADYGDAWGQRISPYGDTISLMSRRKLGEFHDKVETGEKAIRWHGRYTGGHKKVRQLEWTTTVELSKDGRRLNFCTEVDWDTESKRLRVLIPIESESATGTYEVPFGFIDRTYDAARLDYSQWNADHQEYAVQNWFHEPVDAEAGVGLLVKGTPCVRWSPRLLDLSLLRSPEWEFCVVETAYYEFWDIDGQRDTGKHRFEYSLWPHTKALTPSELTRTGLLYNRPQFEEPPFKIDGEVVVTAWKPAEDGQGWILRLQETSGKGTNVRIDFGRPVTVTPCDLLERAQGSVAQTASWEGPLHKHGILTLRVR